MRGPATSGAVLCALVAACPPSASSQRPAPDDRATDLTRVETHDPAWRHERDPFVRPGSVSGPRVAAPEARPEGLAGIALAELVVRGVIATQERSVAFVQGRDARLYVVRAGDRLRDGRVQAITGDVVVIAADRPDPGDGRTTLRVRRVSNRTPRQ